MVCLEDTFVFGANVFIFIMKRVHLQCQKCLSPAQNAFVASVKSHSEVSSTHCHVTSNERVRLQCVKS